MSGAPRVLSIPFGVPFLPALARSLLSGDLFPGFAPAADPLALADVTIYVPTRRAARELRAHFADLSPIRSAILPVIRPLGEFDEEDAAFEGDASALDLAPPISGVDRLLSLAPLARAWKKRLPAHVAQRFAEDIVVPASAADSVWLARDLAALMDEVETEGSDWQKLADLAPGNLSGWWQVTLDFLTIVTERWPEFLEARGQSNPAAHRSALIRLEAVRLKRNPPENPVIAAGSTGSIPATAELLGAIARLPHGAVVLPGLDKALDERSWAALGTALPKASVLGHPQYGLARLLGRIGLPRADVGEIGSRDHALGVRSQLISEALRPAETTDEWAGARNSFSAADLDTALAGITLIEAPKERDEAAAIAVALRHAIAEPGKTAALVASDRELARRVAAELLRFGIRADDSGGAPLSNAAPATLFLLMLRAVFEPGDPVAVLSLLKHPLLALGLDRPKMRHAAETIELVALRGGTGRPDIADLGGLFEQRLENLAGERKPFWYARVDDGRKAVARDALARLSAALAPLARLRDEESTEMADILRASIVALENLGRSADGSLTVLYAGDAGEKHAGFLRGLVAATAPFSFAPSEWPDIVTALIAPEMVNPSPGSDQRVAIWGTLEARLQTVDTLVLGGLNEGTWPRKAQADRFLSRVMKSGIDLEPPERRIGQAAHDFAMAMGARNIILSRSARYGEAPAVASRWLQRILTFAGKEQAGILRARGDVLLAWARALDGGPRQDFARRPTPKPPLALRPTQFSVTEIETLRRDPYAIYARRILMLKPLDPLLRDPGAAERGTLYHDILNRFSRAVVDPCAPDAAQRLIDIGRDCFAGARLPADVQAIWWPRFARLAGNIIAWERQRADQVKSRAPEARADKTFIGATGVTLFGYADRIDILAAGMADILDYKTGFSPSKGQAHTLLAPQLALEAALLKRGAFKELGRLHPADLAFIRLKANGDVVPESILSHNRQVRSADDLAEDAWARLEKLLLHYADPTHGYLSRALPFRDSDTDGDYDHLARVLEWSAGDDGVVAEAGDE